MPGMVTIYAMGPAVRQHIDAAPDLETLQKAVGGYIEAVPFFERFEGEPAVAFCNEEGKLNGLPFNAHATSLWHMQARMDDVLVGNVVVVYGADLVAQL